MLESCARAYPATGTPFLDRIVDELVGDGLLRWLYLDPLALRTTPDSLAFGFDAVGELRRLRSLPITRTEGDISRAVAQNIFRKNILPAYDALPKGDETRRAEGINLLWQALQAYRSLDHNPEYLDFVWNELTEEHKFAWLDISESGEWMLKPFLSTTPPFDPLGILEQLHRENRERYPPLEARARVADRRYKELEDIYYREISEFKYENRLEERRIAVELIRKIKGVFRFFARPEFLELPIRELSGHGRIRWQSQLLGIFALPENYYENQYFNFDYRRELSEFRAYRDTAFQWMEHTMRQTGDL